MTFVHGKSTYLSLAGTDISAYTTKSTFERGADTHDITTYGSDDYKFQGGLGKNEASAEGIYDNTATTGPRDLIEPLIGTTVTFVRRPEGTGSGKPQDSVSVVVEKYVETSPVADLVTWSVDLKCTGAVTSTDQ